MPDFHCFMPPHRLAYNLAFHGHAPVATLEKRIVQLEKSRCKRPRQRVNLCRKDQTDEEPTSKYINMQLNQISTSGCKYSFIPNSWKFLKLGQLDDLK
jgi:hypothetical protein